MQNSITGLQLHLITNCSKISEAYFNFIEVCASSGITHLQLRQKNWSAQDLINFGQQLQEIIKPYGTKLIINDNINLALELNADGVHLGQTDGDIKVARRRLGYDKIIGLSIESEDELRLANLEESLDYVAASAVFPSTSKSDLKKIWGVDGLQQFCQISRHPVVAIGGIDINNIKSIKKCKIDGIAIINSIHNALNPKEYIKQLLTN